MTSLGDVNPRFNFNFQYMIRGKNRLTVNMSVPNGYTEARKQAQRNVFRILKQSLDKGMVLNLHSGDSQFSSVISNYVFLRVLNEFLCLISKD